MKKKKKKIIFLYIPKYIICNIPYQIYQYYTFTHLHLFQLPTKYHSLPLNASASSPSLQHPKLLEFPTFPNPKNRKHKEKKHTYISSAHLTELTYTHTPLYCFCKPT